MSVIRCTANLLKQMGLSPAKLTPKEPQFSYLGQWHANLLHIDRRKCVLFVNDKTLYSFIAPDISRAQIRNLAEQFRGYLSCVVNDGGFSELTVDRILAEYDEIEIGKTNNRSVIASMNEIAFHYKVKILKSGGVHSWHVPEIIRELNRMPLKAIEFRFSVEKLNELYTNVI